jgi:predicted dehydrogenase
MSPPHDVSRRAFLRNTAVTATTVAAPSVISARALGKDGQTPPSERIQVGLIGCGGMGLANLSACASQTDVVVTALCDVWQARLERAAAPYKASARTFHDHRELLARRDVDGVIIATPPHWHCRIAVDACEAGKDLYVQKPMTLHLAESLAVRNAVKKHGRVCQVGTQIHASENYRRAVEWVRSGRLGKITVARTFNVMNQGPTGIGNPPAGAPPEGLDWDRWVGPVSMRPYHPLIVSRAYENCSFLEFSGGWTPGMAPHIVDLPVWALDLGYPTLTCCTGGRFAIHDAGDAPDTQEATWQYPGFTLTWMMSMVNSFGFDFGRGTRARRLGIYFHGVNGTLFSDYGKHEVVPEGDLLKDTTPPEQTLARSPGHEREWLDCIRSRTAPSCNPEYHCRVDVPIALANLALKLGRAIRFDPERAAIIDDAEARRLSKPEYRSPWKFPDEYL